MKKILSFLAIAMIMMGLSACSGGGAASTPDEAVKNALNALKSADVKALSSACCYSDGTPIDISKATSEEIKALEAALKENVPSFTYTITNTDINPAGDRAKVTVTLTANGDQAEKTFKCIKCSDGKWRVDEKGVR